MGARYLTDLAAVLRAWGLTVHEEAGWETRARGSGGFEAGRPTHVMVHHTASNTSPANDVSYIAHGADSAPLANLYLARTGEVTVIAAGATNTNGSGEDTWGGGVPDDAMNTHAIGVEAANTGTGETWPQAQTDAYLTLCRALSAAYAIPTHHVRGHAEWAPGRKIDPAGPPRWATGAATWRMDDFRFDAQLPPEPGPEPGPIPPPHEENDDMGYIAANTDDPGNPQRFYVTAVNKRAIVDEQEVERMKRRGLLPAGFDLGNPNDPALEWMSTAQLNTYATV